TGAPAQTPITAPVITQRYALDASFDPGTATLTGEMTVAWTNTTGEPQDTLPLRLYPNAEYYADGGVEIDDARVEGEIVAMELDPDDPTVAWMPLGGQVPPGDSRTVTLSFTTTVPTGGDGGFGI